MNLHSGQQWRSLVLGFGDKAFLFGESKIELHVGARPSVYTVAVTSGLAEANNNT